MRRCWFVFLLMNAWSVFAGEIQVTGMEHNWHASHLTLNPKYQIASSDVIDEAIDSGIELTLIAKLYCQKKRSFWFDETLEQQQTTLKIRYFSLSGLYQLHDTVNDERHSFVSLLELWRHLESKTHFNVELNVAQASDYFSVRLRLDAGALPSAMQLPVLLSNDWRFKSNWFESESSTPPAIERP